MRGFLPVTAARERVFNYEPFEDTKQRKQFQKVGFKLSLLKPLTKLMITQLNNLSTLFQTFYNSIKITLFELRQVADFVVRADISSFLLINQLL